MVADSCSESVEKEYLYFYFEIGGQFPTDADYQLRREIGDLIEARGIGKVDGGGGGMGVMGIDHVVDSHETAKAAVMHLLDTAYPNLNYRFTLFDESAKARQSDPYPTHKFTPAQVAVRILILALAVYGAWDLANKIF